jgi:CubicO group peptidase (beta-lactamase class C family)
MEALLAGRLFKKSGTLDEKLTLVPFSPDHPLSAVVKEYGLGLMKASLGGGITAIGHGGGTEGGYPGFVYRIPDKGITISGAVNMMDPAAAYLQLIPRLLEVLAPGYTMPEVHT